VVVKVETILKKYNLPAVTVGQLEFFAEKLDIARAAAAYQQYGALVIRGLSKPYVEGIRRDLEAKFQESLLLLDQAQKIPEGWRTPNGALFIPAPQDYRRDKQIMVLPLNYHNSAAFFSSALNPRQLDLVEAILGPNIELFDLGQALYKEAVGGHPKNLHQDAAYFEHKYEGPVGVLNYAVDTDLVNGALHVIPGTHRLGVLKHVDTFSHLGLEENEWPWEAALPICGSAGDAIFFHVKTVHGSKTNQSSSARPVFIHRYRRIDDYVTVSATTETNRTEAEKRAAQARRDGDGLLVRGFRPYKPA